MAILVDLTSIAPYVGVGKEMHASARTWNTTRHPGTNPAQAMHGYRLQVMWIVSIICLMAPLAQAATTFKPGYPEVTLPPDDMASTGMMSGARAGEIAPYWIAGTAFPW